jgi:hypothetical protein
MIAVALICIEQAEAQFVVTKDIVLYNAKAPYYLTEGQALGLLKSSDGKTLYIGESGDVLALNSELVINDLLKCIQPANFDLALDEEEGSYIKSELFEQKVSNEDKILRATNRDSISPTISVSKIRTLKGELV